MNISLEPKIIISDVLYKQTGVDIEPKQIDFVTAYNVANAVVALDQGSIDREQFNRISLFNINLLLDREGHPMFFKPFDNYKILQTKYSFLYSEKFVN